MFPPPWTRPMASLDAPDVAVLLGCCHHLEEVLEGPAGPVVLHEHHTDNGEDDGSPQPRVSVCGLQGQRMAGAWMGTATACPQQGQASLASETGSSSPQLLTLTVATCRSTAEISGTTTARDRQTDSAVM